MKNLRKVLFVLFGFIVGYLALFTFLHIKKVPNKYVISLASGFITATICLLLTTFIKKGETICDNEVLFSHPFKKAYWKCANGELKVVKNICMVSILLAIMMICKMIPIPSGFGRLGIGFTFLFFSVTAMLYGPVTGILVGFLSDTLGFILFPGGFPYFFGYTFNAMATGFIYGICFYKTKITFFKSFLARFFVNILINAVLGSVWWGMVSGFTEYSQYISYFITLALPKNLAYLIPQSALIYVMFKCLLPLFSRLNLIDVRVKDSVSIF